MDDPALLEDDERNLSALNSKGQVLTEMDRYGEAIQNLNLGVAWTEDETVPAYSPNGRGLALGGLGRDSMASIRLCPENAFGCITSVAWCMNGGNAPDCPSGTLNWHSQKPTQNCPLDWSGKRNNTPTSHK